MKVIEPDISKCPAIFPDEMEVVFKEDYFNKYDILEFSGKYICVFRPIKTKNGCRILLRPYDEESSAKLSLVLNMELDEIV